MQSVLIGGHNVAAVLARTDYWYCQFFEYVLRFVSQDMWVANRLCSNYDCTSQYSDQYMTFADGVNNLASIGWGTRIHSLRCNNQNPRAS